MDKTYYKALKDGRSCWHYSGFEWSLPTRSEDGSWIPGEWHELKGPLRKPSNAFHATDTLARWWMPGCTGYVIEFDGETENDFDEPFTDHKVWGLKARLARPMTSEELIEQKIFAEGVHSIQDGLALAYGNATVRADGNATVRAYGNATVRAYGNATVRADGNAAVEAYRNATVEAYGNATVRAYGNATVGADGNATVEAYGNAAVGAYGNATVRADGNATVRADRNATVRAYGNATVGAYGNATVEADGNATVNIYESWWTRDPKVTVGARAVLIDRRSGKPIITVAQ